MLSHARTTTWGRPRSLATGPPTIRSASVNASLPTSVARISTGCAATPKADETVRLTAAHRLVELPERRRRGVSGAAPEAHDHFRQQVHQIRARICDLAVVGRVSVGRTFAADAVHSSEKGHLDVVDGPSAGCHLAAKPEHFPPWGCFARHQLVLPVPFSKSSV